MIFRPSDDVLEGMSADAQVSNTLGNSNYNEGASSQGERLFFNADDESQPGNNLQDGNSDLVNELIGNQPVEEIKSPDLSELLKNNESSVNEIAENSTEQNQQIEQDQQTEQDFSIDLSEIQSVTSQDSVSSENNQENILQNAENPVEQVGIQNSQEQQNSQGQQNPVELSNEVISIDGKMGDDERVNLVSGVEGSLHSNLDFLVDAQWSKVIEAYRKIYRIIFRRGIFIFAAVLGIFTGVFVQVKASQSGNINIIGESSVVSFIPSDSLEGNSTGVNMIIPYGISKMNSNDFLTKSNLVSYNGIILPQLASIDINSTNLISLEDFENNEISRMDLENLLNVLIKNDSLNRKMKNFSNVSDYKGQGQTLQGGLIENFSLGCMFTKKVSNVVCDKFLDIFYKYGKYYNLFDADADLLKLVKEIKKQNKSVEPVCDMVKEYVLHSNVTPSDTFSLVMNYCNEEDQRYYKKLVGFIDVENSLKQPELSSVVFDDPDLNAYKLLSARQNVYKILDGASLNKDYIISYLKFAQNLIDKDKGTYKYLGAIYTDLLYVFNMDELYDKLLKSGELSRSSDIKLQIDQLNNGNSLLKHESLLSNLTTPNIIVSNEQFTGVYISDKTIEDVFAQYYSMTDRLSIDRVTKLSDTTLMVQTQMFSDKINSVVGDTLKATVYLYRINNSLYVEKIHIGGQPLLSEILNVYASDKSVSFYDMIQYIDEVVGMHYNELTNNVEKQKTLCEQLRENEDIVVYDCDDSNILLYHGIGNIEYSFKLENGILQSFSVSDEDLENYINRKLGEILFNRDNTPTIIKSIIGFELEETEEDDNSLDGILDVLNHFKIHFGLIPDDVQPISGEDNMFLVEFTLKDEFTLHARYNVDTHLLTRISYYECGKTLEIRNLTIKLSADNEAQLKEILNNPRAFLTRANPAAYEKYKMMCEG